MLKNMLKTAWRSSLRNKQFTLLNILGLAIGITTSFMIGLYVLDELSFDNFHQHEDRIYRVNQSSIWGDWEGQMSGTGPNVAIALRTDIPEFEQVTKILPTEPFGVAYRSNSQTIVSFLEENLLVAEENFFDVFSFEVLQGNPSTALSQPYKIVITEQIAIKYFGDRNALGKILHLRGTILEGANEKQELWQPYEVSAVLKNTPENSHIQFDMLTSMSSYEDIKSSESTWVWTGFANYALVKESTDLSALKSKLNTIPPKWAEGTLLRVFGQTFEELEKDGKAWELYLQPLDEIYLDNQLSNPLGAIGSKRYLIIFSTVGLIILALSCINFINLATARSSDRAKEVGIRKVLGSQKKWLIRQFIFESILYALVSTLIAVVATELSLNAFNEITEKELSLNAYLTNLKFLGGLFGFTILLGFVAGTYPAFYLSSFKPAEILKGKAVSGVKGKSIRNALVIFQFTASIALIISAFFVQKQLKFSMNFDVGYEKEHVLQLHNIERLGAHVDAIKNSLSNNPTVTVFGQSHEVPPNIYRGDIINLEGSSQSEISVKRMKSDADYLKLLDLNWLAGRNFSNTISTDQSSAVVLNAAAVKALGIVTQDNSLESSIGKFVTRGNHKFEVIGIVDNFHYNSLKNEVLPLIIYHIDNPFLPDSGTSPSFLSLRLNYEAVKSGKDLKHLIESIESDLHQLDDSFPFEYSFMDQTFEHSFRNEQKMGQVLNIFTVMALVIACLGLFGLAAFSAEQRTKELGIRKVLGAKALHLVLLFSTEFTKLVTISLLIATPLAYYLVQGWLSDFAYRTPINLWVFVLAGISALVVAWGTISFQSLKSARTNPVEALKNN